MSNLIFVPELGLISGKSQNLQSRQWFPKAHSNRLHHRSSSKSRKPPKPSPFTQTQQLAPLRNSTKSPKASKSSKKSKNLQTLTALEVSMQPRPTTSSVSQKRRPNKDPVHPDQVFCKSALEVSLQSRPMTMAGLRKKQSVEGEGEGFAYLPTLSSRPLGTTKFICE